MDRRASPDGFPYRDRTTMAQHSLGPLRLDYYNKAEGLAALEGEHVTVMVHWSHPCRDPGTLTRLLVEAPALYDALQELALAGRQLLRDLSPPPHRDGIERLRETVRQAGTVLARVRAKPRSGTPQRPTPRGKGFEKLQVH